MPTIIANRNIDDLIETWTPQLREAFLNAIALIQDRTQLQVIVAALARGDVEAAVRAVGLDPITFREFEITLAASFESGGSSVVGSIPALRQTDGSILRILFDARNPRAERWLRVHTYEMVREIVEDQRTAIREHLVAGMEAGENPRKVALDLVGRLNPTTRKREGGVLGLTSTQAAWVRNYEAELRDLKGGALGRAMRDKRFDKTVARAIAKGEPLSSEQITRMVSAYRNRALKLRAEGLARTEAMSALNQSQYEATEQAIDAGQIKEQYVTKQWKSAFDKRVRHSHAVLHNQTVPFRRTFVAESGERLRFPGDPNASAAERINCRCSMHIRIDYIRKALDEAA